MEAGSIAVIGASNNREKYGNKALRAWASRGYTVFPINPNEAEVEGMTAYPRVTDVPGPVEIATLYVPAEVGITLLDDLKAKGIQRVFVNPGAESPELIDKAQLLGLETIQACSIIASGSHPRDF